MGYTIMEEIMHDDGVVLNPTLQDYLIPTSTDIPEIALTLVEHGYRYGPFGAKGMGEASLIPMASAIGNAIYNATGVWIRELPATPKRRIQYIYPDRSLERFWTTYLNSLILASKLSSSSLSLFLQSSRSANSSCGVGL